MNNCKKTSPTKITKKISCPTCGYQFKKFKQLRCPRCNSYLFKKCSECAGCSLFKSKKL